MLLNYCVRFCSTVFIFHQIQLFLNFKISHPYLCVLCLQVWATTSGKQVFVCMPVTAEIINVTTKLANLNNIFLFSVLICQESRQALKLGKDSHAEIRIQTQKLNKGCI